jgi:hypothetical protein
VDVGRYLNIHELSRGHWLKVAEAGKMPGPEDPEADKVFLKAYGTTMPEYSGYRLFSEISRFMEILAYEDGFDYMFSENSMPATQRTYAQFPGYELVMEVPYTDLRLPPTGEKPDLSKVDIESLIAQGGKPCMQYVVKRVAPSNPHPLLDTYPYLLNHLTL